MEAEKGSEGQNVEMRKESNWMQKAMCIFVAHEFDGLNYLFVLGREKRKE